MLYISAGFGATPSTGTSLFGATQTGTTSLFGNKPFGTATTTQSAGFGFGTSTGSVFGQPQQTTVSTYVPTCEGTGPHTYCCQNLTYLMNKWADS